MILGVGPGGRSDAVAGRAAGAGAGGVVARPGLWGRLGGPARVTVVSAPPRAGPAVQPGRGQGRVRRRRGGLPEPALVLQERTEGWAAGLRLAALSLVGHPDPQRFAAEFSGSERTVAEYLLAEVLDRQPDRVLISFLIDPAPGLLERHARQATAHAALVADLLSLLAGRRPTPPPAGPRPLPEPLSESEIRVLRYLPTILTAPEIAGELYVSPNTVKTHVRSLYAKLGTHRRAVARARGLGLLAPSARR